MIFNIDFLPARYGDSIWITYGDPIDPYVILIDGGTGGTRKNILEKIASLPGIKKIDLLVITHIDRDHIEGILKLLSADEIDFSIGTIWFNGWNHLPGNEDIEPFGALQGERLTSAIKKHRLPWNKHFNGKAVCIHADQSLPEIMLPGGMQLTILSPTSEHLSILRDKWEKEVLDANLLPGFGLAEQEDEDIESFGEPIPDIPTLLQEEFKEDNSAANGSSIAFEVSYQGKTALFAGDAFPRVLLESLNRLHGEGKIPFDLVKLAHHGSGGSTSPALLKKLAGKKFIFSSSGAIYKHPSPATIARVLDSQEKNTELIFNYRTPINKVWEIQSLRDQYHYTALYPENEGISISLL